jgi:diguanylate cyclase (GGDEF)-like protein/PAS domain S-box-containing protein
MEPWQAPEFRVLATTLNSMAAAIAHGQESLRESEAELRLLADNATDMIFKLDLDFRRTYVSPSSREVLGYEPHELIGKRPANMAHPDDVKTVSGSYQDLVSGMERALTMTRIQHKDGRWIWVEVHKRALLDAETGAPIGIIGSMRDVSRRKQIEDELAAANRQLRALATQDGLTGLANRRTFDEVFDRECSRAKRSKAPLGLIMLDVDEFKAFNDLYGHQAGDAALCTVSRAIEAALHRPADFAARYGGEEFVIVLPGTDETGTIEVAERIRQSVESAGLHHRGSAGGIVTISAGVWASGGAKSVHPREALQCADANLYAAKATGRNRVACASIAVAQAG